MIWMTKLQGSAMSCWRHDVEILSALLAFCQGNPWIFLCMRPINERRRFIETSSLISWAHPQMITWIRRNSQRASTWNTQNSKCFFIASIIINKLLNKQSSCMWFQTPWPSHHCNGDHKALSHHDKTNPSVTKIHRVVDLPICLVHCFYNEVMCVAKYYAYRTHSHREISIAVMDGLAPIWHHGICKHHGWDYHTLYIAVPDHDDVDRSTFIRSAPA